MFFLCSTQYCGLVQYEIEILISLFVTGYRYIFPISGGVLYILYIPNMLIFRDSYILS